jgi:metallophosphoesterase (TIGR03768 family)
VNQLALALEPALVGLHGLPGVAVGAGGVVLVFAVGIGQADGVALADITVFDQAQVLGAVGAVAEVPIVSRRKPAKPIGKTDGRLPGKGEIMSMHDGRFLRLLSVLTFPLLSTACDGGTDGGTKVVDWPIAADVYTTAQQQILPVALSSDTLPINPNEVTLYEQDGYSAWQVGVALPHEKRTELAPGYAGAPNAARLLSFFSVSDAHISDKESPAQPIYVGWSALYGPTSSGLSAAYSPTMLSTTQVLDAAVQTINALHRDSPFDFGLVLGDDINNSQYNELRWFIDVMDGQVITPSSGAHAGAETIDYQKPFKAVGLDKTIPWYQVLGNHDQFWMGSALEDAKTTQAHVAGTIIDMADDPNPASGGVDQTGFYMGVVDGTTVYGDIVGAGPEASFPTPPTVVADVNRHTLATSESSSKNWMTEFFTTTSSPAGHGFTQTNLDNDFASYTFEPKSSIPIRVIVLDDTCKGPGQLSYALGCLDQPRLDWLTGELQKGQDDGRLLIIAAHIPIKPQSDVSTATPFPLFRTPGFTDDSLLAVLHNYPNLILWISGHMHQNTVTAQPSSDDAHPERGFWEVETASLRDFPQQFRTVDIRRNGDNTISMLVTSVDPAVAAGSPAAKSRGYAIAARRIFGATPAIIADTTSHAYNVELVKQLSPEMQVTIAGSGTPIP